MAKRYGSKCPKNGWEVKKAQLAYEEDMQKSLEEWKRITEQNKEIFQKVFTSEDRFADWDLTKPYIDD
jgi:SRSO17 transposase